jgi:hypothetical protein
MSRFKIAVVFALAAGSIAFAEPKAPEIKQGTAYGEARGIILSAGWQASFFKKSILSELDRDLQGWFLAAGFMEVEECSGTGDGLCIAEFHDAHGKSKLYVFITSGSREEIKYQGHDPQVVSFCVNRKTVNCELPATLPAGTKPSKRKPDATPQTKAPAQQTNWRRVDADNGSAMAIDLNSISRPHYTNGAADAIVCILDNDTCVLLNMRRWRFDCHGHFLDIDHGGGLLPAPPRSVAGALSAIACGEAGRN